MKRTDLVRAIEGFGCEFAGTGGKRLARHIIKMLSNPPPAEQSELAAEILRRRTPDEGVSEAALDGLAADSFRGYDAEEAGRAAP